MKGERRCKVTGNPSGTDTWCVPYGACRCDECQAYLCELIDTLLTQAAAHSASVLEIECIVVAARDVAMRYPWHPDDNLQRAQFYLAVERLQRAIAETAK